MGAGEADGWMLAGAIVSLAFGLVLLASGALQLGVDLWIVVVGILRIARASRLRASCRCFRP